MKSIVIILSLMGCDDAAKSCEYIETKNTVFASQEACLRASEQFFAIHADASYPMVLAKCDVKTPTQLATRPAELADAQAVAVEFAPEELEKQGWFCVKIENAAGIVKAPIVSAAKGVVTTSGSAANWVADNAKSAIDFVNPF